MTVYILGGGPTALALAQDLSESQTHFVLLEKSQHLGGLATTLTWKHYGDHDLGPHKIFTLDQALFQKVKNLLPPDQWLTRPKLSRIYMQGHYLSYPPSPFSLIGIYGLFVFSGMVLDYLYAMLKSRIHKQQPVTFKEDLEKRVGKKLYRALFEPIARKLWGDPAGLSAKLSQGRVQTPSLLELALRTLKIKQSSTFEALQFDYPRGGLKKLWDAIVQKTENFGRFELGCEIKSLQLQDGRIIRFSFLNRDGQTQEIVLQPDDFVFSTLPLVQTGKYLNHPVSEQTVALNDLMLVFLKIDRPSLLHESWIFVPDPDIVFHRLSEQESFDPEMTPNGSIVCCEIMDHSGRDLGQKNDTVLLELVSKGLAQMGFQDFKIQDSKIIKLPKSYPVFRPGFEMQLSQTLGWFDALSNFKTIGRQGAFNYIGTLDCMDIGYGAARWFKNGAKLSDWNLERIRTSHYPVLD